MRRLVPLVAVAAAAALVLAGCASASGSAGSSGQGSSSAAFPITIEHAFGETTIAKKPTRVAAITSENADAALALGVVPAGIAAQSYGDEDGDGLMTWTAAKLTELGAKTPALYPEGDTLDYEAIADSRPDVILAAYSGITKEEYQTLSKIAPVVAYPKGPWLTTWTDTILIDGKALGLEPEAKAYVAEQKAAIEKATAGTDIAGRTAMFGFVDPTKLSSIGYYTDGDARAGFLTDLGFTEPGSIKKLSKSSTSFYDSVSSENADAFDDVDVIVVYGDDKLLPAMQADPLLGTIPAIRRGAVVVLDNGTQGASMSPPDALSISWVLKHVLPLITKATAAA